MPSSRRGPVAVAGEHVPLTLLFVLLAAGLAGAQPSSTPPVNYNYLGGNKFTPAMAVLLVALIAAFFFLGFFSIYIRHCGRSDVGGSNLGGGLAAVMARSRRQRGLDAAVIESFPKMRYAEAKELMVGKETLECAVCLSEFEDDEELRMLPKCSHVFHPDCIDAWLEAHVTCPVCRCNLDSDPASADDAVPVPDSGAAAPREEEATGDETAAPVQEVAINVHESNEEEERRKEAMELERIGSQRRAIRSRSGRQPAGFARSHSTGHSLAVPLDRNLERFTLRLPEHVRKDMIAAGEASLRRGRRAGDGSSRGGARSVRLGRSDRWPPFIRTFSARVPFWGASSSAAAASRREGEGSTTRGRRAASARVGVAGEEPVEGAPVAAIARQV